MKTTLKFLMGAVLVSGTLSARADSGLSAAMENADRTESANAAGRPVPDETEVLKARRIFDSPVAGLTEIGTLRPRRAKEIVDSRIAIGFECLDRELFDPNRCYDLVAESGAKYARCQTGWSRCEKEKGVYDFRWLDDIVDNFARRGVEAWFDVTFGNTLYMTNCYTKAAVGNVPLYYGEECKAAWCAYVRALARHFKGRVRHWEIWNEANIRPFWVPHQPDPGDYVKLIALTAGEIRREIPDARIGAGVSSVFENPYVSDFIRLGGGKGLDFFCVHPYSTAPEHLMHWDAKMSYVEAIEAIRRGFAANGAPAVEVWNGESGYNYWFPKNHWLYGNKEEICSAGAPAKWLLRRFLTDRRAGCARSSFFQIVDMVKPYAKSSTVWKRPPRGGLLDGDDYTPRMSWYALRNYNALFPAADYDSSLACRAVPGNGNPAFLPLEAVALREGDKLFFAWWARTAEVRGGYEGRRDGHLTISASACPKDPVVVDLLSGKTYACSLVPRRSEDGKTVTYDGLPVTDWPLVLTERQNVVVNR